MRRLIRVAVLAASAAMAGCTRLDITLGFVPFLATMRNQPNFQPQEMPRGVVTGTVPAASPGGPLPPEDYDQMSLLGGKFDKLPNPEVIGMETDWSRQRGKVMFERNCVPCHGEDGHGKGPVVGPNMFPGAADLMADQARNRSDGYIFGMMQTGRGLMPPYTRISYDDRWRVVNYLRRLQKGETVKSEAPAPANTQH